MLSPLADDSPLGRMLRDARINQIGEQQVIPPSSLVGVRGPGIVQEIYDTVLKPWRQDRGESLGCQAEATDAAVKCRRCRCATIG